MSKSDTSTFTCQDELASRELKKMERTIRQSISILLGYEDPDARRSAAEYLSRSDELAPVAALALALEDSNKGVRDAAFRSLLTIGGLKVARAVVEYIGDENIITRNLVADLLCRIGKPAIPALIPYMHDTDHDVRKFAIDILALIEPSSAVADLVSLLDDPDINVRIAAVEALGNAKNSDVQASLYNTFEKNPETRPSVVEALGKIGDTRAGEYLLSMFRAEMNNKQSDGLLVFMLIEALGTVGKEDALEMLKTHLNAAHGKIANAIIHAMVQIQERTDRRIYFSRHHFHQLLNALYDNDEDIAFSAARGLERFTGDEVTKALIKTLGRSERWDSFLYPLILEREKILYPVLELMEDPDYNKRALLFLIGRMVQITIVSIFRNKNLLFDTRVVDRLFDDIVNEWDGADEEMRSIIVDVLFSLDGDSAVDVLDRVLNDQDPWLKIHFIEILVSINDPRAPDLLSKFLNDDETVVREVAAAALDSKGMSLSDIGTG
jgi:HEAT repeat protein